MSMLLSNRCTYVWVILKSTTVVQVAKAFVAFVAVLLFCFLAGLVLMAVEEGAEEEALAEEADFARRMKDSVSPDIFNELVERGLVPNVDSSGAVDFQRHWDFSAGNSFTQAFLFAFTLASTVGYGYVSLRTQAAKAFSSFFSVVAIPAMMVAYTILAMRILAMVEFLLNAASPRNAYEFAKFDLDHSGLINVQELRLALTALGSRTISDSKLAKMMKEIDRDGQTDTLNYAEFCKLLKMASPPEVEKRKRRVRLVGLVVVTMLWLIFGSAMFVKFEGWTFQTAMWFCWITVSTIGLGDYVPATDAGQAFLVLWATLGLGLTALNVTEICDLFTTVLQKTDSSEEPTNLQRGFSTVSEHQDHTLHHGSNAVSMATAHIQYVVNEQDKAEAEACQWREGAQGQAREEEDGPMQNGQSLTMPI